MSVTIIDVAQAAGVSMKSVSRVINGEPHVTPKLRAKVERAMRELNYTPNMAARTLGGSRAFSIAILFDNPSPAYVIRALHGAYTECRRADYQLVLENLDSRDDVVRYMQSILTRRLDGMILTPPTSDNEEILKCLEESGLPYLRVSPTSFPDRAPAVGMDDTSAAAEIAVYLWEQGHRSFGIVNGPERFGASIQRRKGFWDKLTALGATGIRETEGAFTFGSGLAAGLRLLDQGDRPTAILAANDDMAAGVLAAAGQIGLRVPDDLSVTGFDDSWIAQSVWPPLTTVYQPIAEMAAAATRRLLRRDAASDASHMILPHQLVIRDSVKTIAR